MKRTKRIGYTLTTGPGTGPGITAYTITGPDGSHYCSGQRAEPEKAVTNHYQKSVKRLNAQAGLRTGACKSNAIPGPQHIWKQAYKGMGG